MLKFCNITLEFCNIMLNSATMLTVLSQGATGTQACSPLLHAHVIREDDAPERQSKSTARSAATGPSSRARGSLRDPLRNKKREVGKGLSLADTQTGR